MGDFNFEVTRAEAKFDASDGSLDVTFWYPRDPTPIKGGVPANTEFGLGVLENLLTKGSSILANADNPIAPPNAGSLPVFSDGNFVCCRRDDGPIVHSMYHAAYSGYGTDFAELSTLEGMRKLGARESAEEVIFITRGHDPHLVVTKSLEDEIGRSAERLGIGDLPSRMVDEEIVPGRDRLTVKYEDGETAYEMNTSFVMLWNIGSSTIAMNLRKLDIRSDEIFPIDAEYMDRGKYVHFNRESFIVNPDDIRGHDSSETLDSIGYGMPLRNAQVFRSNRDAKGRLEVYQPLSSPLAYLGPGATPVNSPYLWAPQDSLRACLDELGVDGYKGKKLHWEREITRKFHDNDGRESCVIPQGYLAK